jgi:hypothetical protein
MRRAIIKESSQPTLSLGIHVVVPMAAPRRECNQEVTRYEAERFRFTKYLLLNQCNDPKKGGKYGLKQVN